MGDGAGEGTFGRRAWPPDLRLTFDGLAGQKTLAKLVEDARRRVETVREAETEAARVRLRAPLASVVRIKSASRPRRRWPRRSL